MSNSARAKEKQAGPRVATHLGYLASSITLSWTFEHSQGEDAASVHSRVVWFIHTSPWEPMHARSDFLPRMQVWRAGK